MEKKEFIDHLFKQTSDFKNEKQSSMVANLLDTVSSDIYSESQRFVFELIQNADDAAEGKKNEVHFDFLPGALIVSHNGKPFGKTDIDSITDAGASTKRDDPNKTGYKGIGFKSVFGMSERVSIFSDGYQFRFEKAHHSSQLPWQIIPIWSEIDDYNKDISMILKKSNYSVTTIIELSVVDKLYGDLQEIMANGQILLFLRFVSNITVSKNGLLKYTVSKNIVEETPAFSKVSLYRDSTAISEWLVKSYKAIPIPDDTREKLKKDKKAPEKLRSAEFTEMSFAARLEKNKITSIGNGQSLIFTYLPTKVREFSFPFLVNGGFMTSAAREALFEDRLWNQWLFSLIAEKTVSWLCELAGTSYRLQILNIMPILFNQSSNHLKQSFDTAFTLHAKQGNFITTNQLSLKNSSSVLLDATGLSTQSFIDKSSITEFIRFNNAKDFQPDCFVHTELEKSQLLKTIGVETFDKENIGPYFSSETFKNSHQLAENFQLIAYLKKLSDADSKGVWFQTLKDLPFIFDTDMVLCNPENGVCFPTGVVQTELGNIPVIHNDVYREIETNKPIYEWLGKLGIAEPSTVAYVTNVIIPNLSDPNYINIDNYLNITNYLFRLFHRGELDTDILASLRGLKILTTNTPTEFIVAEKAFLSNRYRPKFPIEGTIAQISFVSEIYLDHGDDLKWNEFFTAIKVKEDIEVEIINSNNDLNTLTDLTDQDWVDLAEKEARASANLKGQWGFARYNRINNLRIPSLLNLTVVNYDYAAAFWKRLIDAGNRIELLKEKGVFLYGEGYGKNRFTASVTNYFPWFVANTKCIPTSTGELLLATNVFINTGDIKEIAGKLMPVFEFPTTVPTAWKVFFNFKTELLLTDYLLLLEKICDDAESVEPKERGRVQRIGMIYNKISIILADTAEEDKNVISDWAGQNRVLTGKDVFEDPATLKWVTIPGFSDDSTNLKTIKIPSNTDHKIGGFTELMRLFGVQIISEFVPSYNQAILDSSLKSKLENILPHLVALADKKTVGDPLERFDKLYGILNQTTFFSAKEIKLGFEFEGENFDGPIMSIYRDNNKIYFKGKWTSERTLLHLIKELADLLKLRQFDAELRFLLMESDSGEIADWMVEQGIELHTLLPIRRFTRQITIDSPESVEDALSPNHSNQGNRSEADEMLHHTEDDFGAGETSSGNLDEDQEGEERQRRTVPVFIPVTSVKGLDFTNRPWSSPSTRAISVSQERQYEKVEDEEYRIKVGNWSEGYVNELLQQSPEFSNIIWMNEHGESRKPYDFTAIRNGKLIYIEVKGTQSNDKNLIYLSNGEWQVMKDNTENYIMFRIYSAGTDQSRHEVFENPWALIDNGHISIALEL